MGASIVAGLGVPFAGGEEDGARVSARHAHEGLMMAWREEDEERLTAICRDLDRQHSSWAVKLPGFLDLALLTLRNPHFILVLKEPMSVAMRKRSRNADLDNDAVSEGTKKLMRKYIRAISFCADTEAPAMLVSYDRVMRDRETAVDAIAEFLGISDYDPSAVVASLAYDHDLYFENAVAGDPAGASSTAAESS
jgi:hypothetical protein